MLALLDVRDWNEIETIQKEKDITLNSTLEFSCFTNNIELINNCIDKGAKNLNTALHWACIGMSKEAIANMINKGATVLNHRFLQEKNVQLWLLENGITRKQLISINNINKTFDELDQWNFVVKHTLNEFMIKDLCNIVSSYVCL